MKRKASCAWVLTEKFSKPRESLTIQSNGDPNEKTSNFRDTLWLIWILRKWEENFCSQLGFSTRNQDGRRIKYIPDEVIFQKIFNWNFRLLFTSGRFYILDLAYSSVSSNGTNSHDQEPPLCEEELREDILIPYPTNPWLIDYDKLMEHSKTKFFKPVICQKCEFTVINKPSIFY